MKEPLRILKLDRKRYRVKYCPCGKSNKDGKFIPFVGFENKGYCHACSKTIMPDLPDQGAPIQKHYIEPKPTSFISAEVFNKSLNHYSTNHFITFLTSHFGKEITTQVTETYFIATSKHWNGSTVFWQVDIQGQIRTGKIMLYDPNTGKRVKDPFDHINWAHTIIKIPEYNLQQCFFGEHLLAGNTKPIAIVESEKTAIIASIYLPSFIWLASGGLSHLKPEKFENLKGRQIILFPDVNGFAKWSKRAKELRKFSEVVVSDLLERKATETERKQGADLADYLLKFNYSDFNSVSKPKNETLELMIAKNGSLETLIKTFDCELKP